MRSLCYDFWQPSDGIAAEGWPELLAVVFAFVESGSGSHREGGLDILNKLAEYVGEVRYDVGRCCGPALRVHRLVCEGYQPLPSLAPFRPPHVQALLPHTEGLRRVFAARLADPEPAVRLAALKVQSTCVDAACAE